jgi:hypothetical protein
LEDDLILSLRTHRTTLIGISLSVGLALICVLSTYFVLEDHKAKSNAALKSDESASEYVYGEQGLAYGETLSDEILQVTDQYVLFSDHVLERFERNDTDMQKTEAALTTAFNSLPAGVSKHLMIVPWRIAYEPAAAPYTADIPTAIDEIYETMPQDVQTYDVYQMLNEHKEEHIYFRMHDWWTPLGARYAAEMFCDRSDIPMIALEAYETNVLYSYFGDYHRVYTEFLHEDFPVQDQEPIFYYLLRGGENRQTVTARQKPALPYETFDSPTIAVSRRSTNMFIEGTYSCSILKGDAANGKTLLIVGDSFAKPFAPWFTPYYDSVYLVNLPFYQGSATDFERIFKDYYITDCLIVEKLNSTGNTSVKNYMKGA